jgi:hypothetical protein
MSISEVVNLGNYLIGQLIGSASSGAWRRIARASSTPGTLTPNTFAAVAIDIP